MERALSTESKIREKLPLNRWKISDSKLLRVGHRNVRERNDDIQILYVVEDDLDDAWKVFNNFSFEHFKNVFVIILEIFDFKSEHVEKFLKFLSLEIKMDRDVYLQFYMRDMKFYVNPKASNAFEEIKLNEGRETIIKQLNFHGNKLRRESFFGILKALYLPLVDVSYGQILDFLSQSSEVDNFLLLKNAIKAEDEVMVRILMLFVPQSEQELLDDSLKFKNPRILLSILRNFSLNEVTEEQIQEILEHKKRNEILLTIAKQNDLRMLKLLTNNPKVFKNFFDFKIWHEARKIAFNKNFQEFLYELQVIETEYYDEFDKDIENDIEIFHENIEKKLFTEIKETVAKFPAFKLLLNKDGICALEKAIDCKAFKVYAYLLSQNFVTIDKQTLNAKIDNLNQLEKHEIRDQNLKFLAKSSDDYINILASKFDYFSGPTNSNAAETRRMLEKLKKFEEIREVMKNSIFSDMKIVSDFNTDNISVMDPTHDENANDYIQEIIYIGSSINKNHRYAKFAHELTQFVLFTVYENKCLPYCKGDLMREAEWDQIVEKTRESYENNPDDTDNIIKYVFEFYESKTLQSSQLAVRVNEILAFYFDDPEKIKELEAQHPELFNFYRNRIMIDLRIPNVVRMIKLNKSFGVLDKIIKSPLHVASTDFRILDQLFDSDKKFLVSSVPQLTFSKILNELKNRDGNKLNLKVRNIFVDIGNLDNEFLKSELKSLIRSGCVENVIVDGLDVDNLEDLIIFDRRVSVLIVINEETKNELISSSDQAFEFIEMNHKWKELREKTQQIILNKNVKFQGKEMKLSESLTNFHITPEILQIICTEVEEIFINPAPVDEIEFLMPFYVEKRAEKSFTLEDFLFNEVLSEKVVLISDIAGHGKSTMLSKMLELLSEKSPADWISIVNPKNFNTSRSDLNIENFTEFATQILLNLNALEAAIFNQKFNEGNVKILLDDFHEISKEINEKFKAVLEDFISSQDSNQIFITSRKTYEQDLKADKIVYEIEKFNKKAQTDFFINFWKDKNPGLDSDLIESCSFLMYERIDAMMKSSTKTIGLPLIIQSFANAFKDKINQAFSNMTEHLYISDVFEKIFTSNFKILRLNFNENPQNYIIKSDSILRVFQYFAVVYLLDEEFASDLGLSYDEEEWPFDEIKQCEIIKFNKTGCVEFKNKIYPEFLIAKLMISILKDNKKASEAQLRLFLKILNGEKFQIACFFIDEMLDDFEEKNFKFFEPSDKFCEKILKSEKYRDSILKFSSQEGLCNIFAFVLHLMQKARDSKLYERASKELTTKSRENFTKILSSAKNKRAFGKLLNKLSSNKVMIECLTVNGKSRQETLLSVTISHGWESNVLFLFRRIAESFENDELKAILKTKGVEGENILCSACKNPNLASIECVWEYIENYFKPREVVKLIHKKDKNGDNVLHYAARYAQSDKILSVIFAKIKDFIKEPEDLRKFLLTKGNQDMNALLQSINNDATLLFMFESIFCEHLELKTFIYESDSSGENFLIKLDQFGGDKILQVSYDDLQYAQLRETLRILIQLKKQRKENPKVVIRKRELSIAFLMKHCASQFSSEELEKILTMNKFHCDQNLILKFTSSKTMRDEVPGKILEEYPGDCPFLTFHYNSTKDMK